MADPSRLIKWPEATRIQEGPIGNGNGVKQAEVGGRLLSTLSLLLITGLFRKDKGKGEWKLGLEWN